MIGTPLVYPPSPMPSIDAPYLTADVPGIGGVLRQREDDFIVEEEPLYQPVGSGEHIYLYVEKRGLSTSQLVHLLSRHFDVPKHAVGYAGMKDKNAVTRQLISIHTPGKRYDAFPMLQNERVLILWADMHANKLRLGHLRGNRFTIKVRGVGVHEVLHAQRILKRLESEGVPNFAGDQRFGIRGNNHRLGRLMLARDWRGVLDELLGPDPDFPELNADARRLYTERRFTEALDAFPNACRHERIALRVLEKSGSARDSVRAIDPLQRRFWFTALQSSVFNAVLRDRIQRGAFSTLVEGDVATKLDNGAMFKVDQAVLADPDTARRLSAFEISPTGPLWGATMMRAAGDIDEIERRALEAQGVTPEMLDQAVKQLGDSMGGARRALRVPLQGPSIEAGADEHGSYITCRFELPPGGFATVVMREIMKNESALHAGGESE